MKSLRVHFAASARPWRRYNARVQRPDKSKPMPVKYWTFAGLLLTYWCNARCANCYVCSSPSCRADMSPEAALAFWAGLQRASPHGCRIHIGGGEPFGRWPTLIELARRARRDGLAPLEAVETNAFWATGPEILRDRLAALDQAGMRRLTISTDPYHQQFVPIERVRLAARLAEEVLGAPRVRLRWRDWAAEGFDTDRLTGSQRAELFAEYARKGRDRITGRAAAMLAGFFQLRPTEAFADNPCNERLLRSRHVHVDGHGIVCPGTCAGIVLGRAAGAASIGRIWRSLAARFAGDVDPAATGAPLEVVATLARAGPVGLMPAARERGYSPRPQGYAGKCHLCWDIRRWLFENEYFRDQLGPACVYQP